MPWGVTASALGNRERVEGTGSDAPLPATLDNDECADEEPACEGGRCVNTVGSYHCTCEPPLVLDGSRRRCVSNESQSLGNPTSSLSRPAPPPPITPRPAPPITPRPDPVPPSCPAS